MNNKIIKTDFLVVYRDLITPKDGIPEIKFLAKNSRVIDIVNKKTNNTRRNSKLGQ